MSHVKASGGKINQQSQRNRRGKRLGLKKFGGESVKLGQIIVRQRGENYKPGKGVGLGRDYTIFSMADGVVQFSKKWGRTVVNVIAG